MMWRPDRYHRPGGLATERVAHDNLCVHNKSMSSRTPVFIVPDLLLLALRRAVFAVALDLRDAMGSDDIRARQFAVLELLSQHPGARQSQIGPVLGMRRNILLPTLTELDDRGLLKRQREPDRRAVGLFLTEAGQVLLARCRIVCRAHETRISQRLGVDGRAQLLALLTRIIDPALNPPATSVASDKLSDAPHSGAP